jgi:hypothetical protein
MLRIYRLMCTLRLASAEWRVFVGTDAEPSQITSDSSSRCNGVVDIDVELLWITHGLASLM